MGGGARDLGTEIFLQEEHFFPEGEHFYPDEEHFSRKRNIFSQKRNIFPGREILHAREACEIFFGALMFLLQWWSVVPFQRKYMWDSL